MVWMVSNSQQVYEKGYFPKCKSIIVTLIDKTNGKTLTTFQYKRHIFRNRMQVAHETLGILRNHRSNSLVNVIQLTPDISWCPEGHCDHLCDEQEQAGSRIHKSGAHAKILIVTSLSETHSYRPASQSPSITLSVIFEQMLCSEDEERWSQRMKQRKASATDAAKCCKIRQILHQISQKKTLNCFCSGSVIVCVKHFDSHSLNKVKAH